MVHGLRPATRRYASGGISTTPIYCFSPAARRSNSKGKAPASSTTKGKGKAKAFTTPTNSRDVVMFCVPNMKGHYAICKGRSVTVEKRFDLVGLRGDLPNITAPFTNRQWNTFANPLPDYHPSLVLEFYASYQARKDNMNHRGKVDDFPCLPSVMVRGVEVDITLIAINYLFWEDEIDTGSEYMARIADMKHQFT
ncbi:hypothetical protein HAX54_039626 [Datura stramonium]|uniref:Uncharacterized protein n=1 Tax=Datura stramonium TaxID=4076 RepID=A0ABS8VPX8_DATST|nr:hypothetical protein [Datura stramonium]